MSIHVRCSNPECKKQLSVPDGSAGKKCRCPACKSEISIPALEPPAEEDVETLEEADGAFAATPPLLKGKRRPRHDRDELEDEDDDEDAMPRSKKRRRDRDDDEEDDEKDRRPRGRKRSRRDRDADDDYDEDDEDGDSRDRPIKKPQPCSVLNLLQFLVGVGFLLILAFMPLLTWINVSTEMETHKGKENGTWSVTGLGRGTGSLPDATKRVLVTKDSQLAAAGRPDGLLLMVAVLGMSVLCLAIFTVASLGVLGRQGSRTAAIAAILIAVMASVLFLTWQLAWIWKTVSLAEAMRKDADRNQQGLQILTITSTTNPGLGLFIGLALAMAAAYTLSSLASRVTRSLWCRLFELAGLLLGGLILLLVVRAWDAQALCDAIRTL